MPPLSDVDQVLKEAIDREAGIAGVIQMHLLPFADPKALALLEKFEKALYIGLA
jgi:hypothetical protein